MKKLVFIMMLAAGSIMMTNQANAQVNVNISIGNQPAWAPEDYDNAAYYYLPDLDVYYDVPAHQFVYLSGSRWVRSSALPAAYRNYDLYKVHKVAINEKNAYLHHDRDKKQYASFRGKYDQQPIRDSRDEKYSANKNNWNNNRFAKDNNHGNDKNGNSNNDRKGNSDNNKKGRDSHR